MIEQLEPYRTAPDARVALFDFDGTLSLIRSGWMEIMLNMMMETLGPIAPDATLAFNAAEAYVARLTGQDTVSQMAAFADHVAELGGHPESAEAYKAEFLVRLQGVRNQRIDALRDGIRSPEFLLVPGSNGILSALQDRGLVLFLSSGTDHRALLTEAELLGLNRYFDNRIFGAGPEGSSKIDLLRRIVGGGFACGPVAPERIVFFGDGPVEIAATREIGGLAAGMATDEPECMQVHPKKRTWLIAAGADCILPNYLDPDIADILMPARSLEAHAQ